MEISTFGSLPDGQSVRAFRLSCPAGVTVNILELGCIVESVQVPDRNGEPGEITLGYADLEGWLENRNYFGAIIGRVGGRISEARFSLDGKAYELAANRVTDKERCHIHGGEMGLTRRLWKGEAIEGDGYRGVKLHYLSPDGEEGYPGNLSLVTTYTLRDDGELWIDMEAETDAPTPVNLANHTYWNLSGDPRRSIEDHILQLQGDRVLEIGEDLISTGRILPVEGTPLDFRQAHRIGARIDEDHPLLKNAGGYDHYWVFPEREGVFHVSRVEEPRSGRRMDLFTNQPGVVLYTGNFLGPQPAAYRDGISYGRRAGFCLETQGYPDAPNQSDFPSCTLRPGSRYSHRMVLRFTVH